jgi:hypothetical protein
VTGGLPGAATETLEGAAEFDADLEDLVRLIENSATPWRSADRPEGVRPAGG